MIELQHVRAAYAPPGSPPVLDDVSLHIPRDATLVLLGGSGAGKSTVLKTILRLVDYQGVIRIDGADIRHLDPLALRRDIGMVFQQAALFPHLTAAENIALPLRAAGNSRRERMARAHELLELVGLPPGDYANRFPAMLSGGQQQRVGVARALATRPSYLLMDEPFGALDALTRRKLQDELKELRQRLNVTILFVTHDVMEAASLGDAIAVMEHGRIVQTGTAAELMDAPCATIVDELVSKPLRELKQFVRDSVR